MTTLVYIRGWNKGFISPHSILHFIVIHSTFYSICFHQIWNSLQYCISGKFLTCSSAAIRVSWRRSVGQFDHDASLQGIFQ